MGNERAGDISKRILSPWTSRLDCLSTSAGRKLSINPINLCALCLSAPLRESKTTTREIRRILCPLNPMTPLNLTPPPSQPHAPLSTSRPLSTQSLLCALCLSAPLRESKTTTREIRRILCPLNLMPLSTSRPPLNSINLCALCLSAPLRESKTTTTRETPGSGAAADASSIWYNVDGSSEQPSTAEQSGWRP